MSTVDHSTFGHAIRHAHHKHKRIQEEAHRIVMEKGIVVEHEEELQEDIPIWEQGNLDLYTPEMLMVRHALRVDDVINQKIQLFWDIQGMNKGETGDIMEAGYVNMMVRTH